MNNFFRSRFFIALIIITCFLAGFMLNVAIDGGRMPHRTLVGIITSPITTAVTKIKNSNKWNKPKSLSARESSKPRDSSVKSFSAKEKRLRQELPRLFATQLHIGFLLPSLLPRSSFLCSKRCSKNFFLMPAKHTLYILNMKKRQGICLLSILNLVFYR